MYSPREMRVSGYLKPPSLHISPGQKGLFPSSVVPHTRFPRALPQLFLSFPRQTAAGRRL